MIFLVLLTIGDNDINKNQGEFIATKSSISLKVIQFCWLPSKVPSTAMLISSTTLSSLIISLLTSNVTHQETLVAIYPGGLFSPAMKLLWVKKDIALSISRSDWIAFAKSISCHVTTEPLIQILQPVANSAWMQSLTDAAMHSGTMDKLYLCTAITPSSSTPVGCGCSGRLQWLFFLVCCFPLTIV